MFDFVNRDVVRKIDLEDQEIAIVPSSASSGNALSRNNSGHANIIASVPSDPAEDPQQELGKQLEQDPGIVILPNKPTPFLPPQNDHNRGRKTLVLDLDETLVHSSFRPLGEPDITLDLLIGCHERTIMILKRPGVHEFLEYCAAIFEVVIFTASLPIYADPLLDILDPTGQLISGRLFRDACSRIQASYVKDLTLVGREMHNIVIIDNSPLAYSLQPENAIPIKTWFNDQTDQELFALIPILEELSRVDDVRHILAPREESLHPEEIYHPSSVEKQIVKKMSGYTTRC